MHIVDAMMLCVEYLGEGDGGRIDGWIKICSNEESSEGFLNFHILVNREQELHNS